MSAERHTRLFVISMVGSPRRQSFTERANDATLRWAFFDACTGIASDLVYDEAQARARVGRGLTASELGCYASHYSLWQQLLADSADQYVILEDDVIADWGTMSALAKVDFHGSGVDYMRLYFKKPGRFVVRKNRYLSRSSHLIELRDIAYGTQGYVITRAGAERLAPHFRRIHRPVDDQLDRYWEHGLPNLCLFPFPIVESGESTIGDYRFRAVERSLPRKLHHLADYLRREAWIARHSLDARDWTAQLFED